MSHFKPRSNYFINAWCIRWLVIYEDILVKPYVRKIKKHIIYIYDIQPNLLIDNVFTKMQMKKLEGRIRLTSLAIHFITITSARN